MDDRPARSGGSAGRSDRADARPHNARPPDAQRPVPRRPGPGSHSAARRGADQHHAAPRRRRRYALHLAKLAIATVSAVVLVVTGYGWSSFQELNQGLSTTDVIGSAKPDKATDILLVGLDSRTDAHNNPLPRQVLAQLRAGNNEGELTDAMILVRIPKDGRRAVAISLPRDLYVELPDGYGKHKLNSAFNRAKSATADRLVNQGLDEATVRTQSISAGRRVLLQAVKDLTGVGIDHYAEVNLLGFALLTDAVGGVLVCLKAPVHDKFSGAHFRAGTQLISGPDALAFVRQRHGLPRGDLDRIVRQQAYLASLSNKILTAGTLANPSRVRQLINAAQQSVVLDEDFDVLDLAAKLQGLTAGNIVFQTVPVLGDGDSESDGSVLKVDPEAVRTFVAQAVDPTAPSRQAGPPAKATITVEVFNASAVTGLAKTVSEQLTGQGFVQGTVGNSPVRTTSVVRYPTGGEAAGRLVADTLGGLPVEQGPNLSAGTIQVYLGKNYSGPVKTRIEGASLPAGASQSNGAVRVTPYSPPGRSADTGTAAARSSTAPGPAPSSSGRPMADGNVPCVS